MQLESVKLAYFSPTGTTKAVARGIASGLRADTMDFIDVTTPDARKQPLLTSENELLVIAVPVYMGRVPALLNEWLSAIQAHQTPTVCVVVYGNRLYDNALLELKDIVTSRGGIPVACAAYIGEHAFSNSVTPVATGRPDEDDLRHARQFGQKIREKLHSIELMSDLSDFDVPGTHPYGGVTELWDVDFIAVDDSCMQCGVCAEVCPVGAVDSSDSAKIDPHKCITCCACIKACPQKARSRKPGPVEDAARRLYSLYTEPKKPECFL